MSHVLECEAEQDRKRQPMGTFCSLTVARATSATSIRCRDCACVSVSVVCVCGGGAMGMRVCIYACMYICVYIYTRQCPSVHTCTLAYAYPRASFSTHAPTSPCTCTGIYTVPTHTHAHTRIHTHAHSHIYTHSHAQSHPDLDCRGKQAREHARVDHQPTAQL